jgi:transposase
VRRCQAIPGVGPLTAPAIVATYHRRQFRNDDAFIAFMGMDVRIRESGRFRGRQHSHRQPYQLALRERGWSSTAAFVALDRKMARLCCVLLNKETDFDPNFCLQACMTI